MLNYQPNRIDMPLTDKYYDSLTTHLSQAFVVKG